MVTDLEIKKEESRDLNYFIARNQYFNEKYREHYYREDDRRNWRFGSEASNPYSSETSQTPDIEVKPKEGDLAAGMTNYYGLSGSLGSNHYTTHLSIPPTNSLHPIDSPVYNPFMNSSLPSHLNEPSVNGLTNALGSALCGGGQSDSRSPLSITSGASSFESKHCIKSDSSPSCSPPDHSHTQGLDCDLKTQGSNTLVDPITDTTLPALMAPDPPITSPHVQSLRSLCPPFPEATGVSLPSPDHTESKTRGKINLYMYVNRKFARCLFLIFSLSESILERSIVRRILIEDLSIESYTKFRKIQ